MSLYFLHIIRNCKNNKFVGIILFFLKKYKNVSRFEKIFVILQAE